jgi:hypothetical protein
MRKRRDARRPLIPQNQDLVRSLHAAAVYFVLRGPLDRDRFDRVSSLFESRATSASGSDRDSHWQHLQERLTGAQPAWDTFVPAFEGPVRSPEDGVRFRATWHSVLNIVARRGFRSYLVDGVECTLDYFNPANELRLPYRGAGEQVLAVVMHGNSWPPGSTNRDLQRDLSTADSLFDLFRWMDRILDPEWVVGTYSLAAVLLAYREGRIDPDIRPWEFFYHLTVMPLPELLTVEKLRAELPLTIPGVKLLPRVFRLARVDRWPERRTLVLVTPGFWAVIGGEMAAAAAALFGRRNFQETIAPVMTFHRGPDGSIESHRHRKRMDRRSDPAAEPPADGY